MNGGIPPDPSSQILNHESNPIIMTEVIDLTGERFGRLTVIRRCENKNGGRFPAWTCKCDCGKTVDVLGCNLRTGNTQSCGCYSIELCRARSVIHGLSNHPLQKVYTGIMTRCYNPNCRSYKNYGAKGYMSATSGDRAIQHLSNGALRMVTNMICCPMAATGFQ